MFGFCWSLLLLGFFLSKISFLSCLLLYSQFKSVVLFIWMMSDPLDRLFFLYLRSPWCGPGMDMLNSANNMHVSEVSANSDIKEGGTSPLSCTAIHITTGDLTAAFCHPSGKAVGSAG